MTPVEIGLTGIAALIVLMLLRIPVGFVMAIVGIAGFSLIVGKDAALGMAVRDFFSVFSSYNITVVPLFILMGQVAHHAGISSRLFQTAHAFLGHLRGGLAIATIGACAGFSAICGSTSATAATMASVALPQMKKYRYDAALATGVVAAGGSLGILIPPSTIFIIYGIMTEQSVGKLFMAGILPGILLSLLFIFVIVIWTRLQPDMCMQAPPVSWKVRIAQLKGLLETLVIFLIVMGGLFLGFFTPTEAAAVGAFTTLLSATLRKNITWEKLLVALEETTRISCMILVIVAGATIFGHFLAVTTIPMKIGEWVAHLPLPPWMIVGAIIFIYLIMGCLMDSLAMIMLTVPLFFPIITTLGYDPIWFGVIIVVVTEMGVLTPPVGINVYVVASVARDVPLGIIFRGACIMLTAQLILTVLLIIFPQIALYLPSMMR
ncbi:MAG: TRAP transporter large permease [Syntrophales bacterium]|nr:TRAP transporter large permease [Syntrophales bacterium]